MKRKLLILGISLMLVLTWVSFPVPVTAGPATIYVDADAGGANDGSDWADAFNNLQDALAAAVPGDQIWVAEGIYKPDEGAEQTPEDRGASFAMKNWVEIYGGFAGTETERSQRNPDPATNGTILSGDIKVPGDTIDNVYHVLIARGGITSSAILDGFTITAGNANNSTFPNLYGGGMYIEESSPTITNCIFTGNLAEKKGGGMYNNLNCKTTLTNCTFSGNSATEYGGGMYNAYNNIPNIPMLTNCTFSDNSSDYGGGIYNNESSLTLTDCTFSGNSATGDGGGMTNLNSSPTLTNCTFSSNSASGADSDGGGMVNFHNSIPDLIDCTFSGNSATTHGGGMYNEDNSNPTLTGCTFDGNSADTSGGGMFSYSSCIPDLTDCTFSGNSAMMWGGGMLIYSTSLTLTDCTFSGNEVVAPNGDGGGIYNFDSAPTLNNCSFSGNSAPEYGGGICNEASSPELNDCTFSDNSADYRGAGIHNFSNSSPTLTGCIFSGNEAVDSGGGIDNYSSNPILTDCTFSGNLAAYGGGMSNYVLASPTLTNCVFDGNLAAYGGGMYNQESGNPILANCTFSGNSASADGGGIYNFSNSNQTLTNCVLWGNSDSGGTDELAQIYNHINSSSAVDYCCLQGWTGALGGTGNIGDDPLFVDADGTNGIPGDTDDNLRLSVGSPCIDAGYNDGVPAGVTTDIDGASRILDGDHDENAVVDMGAYEYRNGRIDVTSTPAGAGFTISGAAIYSGTTPWSESDAPTGEYTITWGDLAGYTKPSVEVKELSDGGSISFNGVYIEISPGEYTLTVNVVGNGSVTIDPEQSTYTSGTSVELTAKADTGWTFSGWSGALTGSTKTETIIMSSDKTVTATFTEIIPTTYNLTYTAGPNGTLSGDTSQTVNQGEDGTAVEAIPDTGYEFVDWSDGSTDNPRTDTNVASDISVTGNFAVIALTTYNLTYMAGPNGTLTGDTAQTVNEGEAGTAVEAIPDTGYEFVEWSDDSTDNPRTDTNVTSDISVTATFAVIAPTTYNLTYTAGSNGTLTGDTAQTVNEGEGGTAVEAVPDTGYKFVDWSDGVTDNPRTDTNVTLDISVTANFTVTPTDVGTITVTSDPEGMSFTLSGPASYSGTTPWSVSDAPVGEYTITWEEMEDDDTPSSTTHILEKDGSISFDSDTSGGGGGLSGGAIAWIVVGSIAGLAVVFFAIKQWVFKG